MTLISPEEMERYRNCVSGISVSASDKDELILIVHQIMQHFVDAAFGEAPDQLTLSSLANTHFQGDNSHAKVGTSLEHEIVDLVSEGAKNNPISPKG